MFSSRVPRQLRANAFSQALSAARTRGRDLIDLTISNPTRCGITYPAQLFTRLSGPEIAQYRPEPFGMRSAREAVAADYARRRIQTRWDRIVLTAGTSEGYSVLFKLLCAPEGDQVLVPAPSYPLFDHLTALDGVGATQYALHYDGRWWVDFDTLDRGWNPRTRAVLAVSPNNPTGSVVSDEEYLALTERCSARNAALIVDEVFADYPLSPAIEAASAAVVDAPACLSFRLGGLSKSAALPQLKLGWIAVDGPPQLVDEALQRLELICDTYLSVSSPVQVAAPDLIEGGAAPRAQVLERIRTNDRMLRELASRHPSVDVLNTNAGWSSVIRVTARASEEEITLDLLEREGVIVYPGFFFDFPREAFLVVSLLPEPARFHEGVRRVLERVDG
jgi:aspartate/methionine/tyrosine aminotransferase